MFSFHRAFLSLLLVLCASVALAQSDSLIHRVRDGETLAEIAERYLGGREYVPELLAFNSVQNPTLVGPGTVLAIPLDVRRRALQAIDRSQAALAEAREAGAEQFAATLYREAASNHELARGHRLEAEYAKASAMAERSAVLAAESIEEANRNANEPKDGRVMLVHGLVEISEDDGATWRTVRAGEPLPLTALIRTDAQARAEVRLEDGSEIQVREASQLSIAQFLRDQRSGRTDAELRVILGEMLGRIKPKATDDSELEIQTGGASIAVRGTVLRVKADDGGDTRTELLDGLAEVRPLIGRSRGRIELPPQHGLLSREGRAPARPVPLLPPPEPTSPATDSFETARQQLSLEWAPLQNARCRRVSYRVELAQDDKFNRILLNETLSGTRIQTDVLAPGDYYWRVSSLDRNLLQGSPTEPRVIRVRKNLDVDLVYTGPLVQHAGTWVGAAETQFDVHPAEEDTSVVRLEYSANGAPFRELTRPLQFWQEAEVDLRVRGVGLEGDSGREQRLRFRVDATPPEVTVEVGRPSRDAKGQPIVQARINVRDDTGVERVEYSLDGAAFAPYEAPIVLSALQSYRLTVRAVDLVGNRSPDLTFLIAGEWVPRGDLP